MDDTLSLNEVTHRLRRTWWIPLLLLVAGAVAAVLATGRIDKVHHAQGTVVVGSVDADVTKSSSLRASESLARFYADLARRQVVLSKVAARLPDHPSWLSLRDQVSASVPDSNPRLVTVRTTASDQPRAIALARHVIDELVALNPPAPVATREFVAQQVENVRASIDRIDKRVKNLRTALVAATDPVARQQLLTALAERERALVTEQHTYVDLLSLDASGDTGALRPMDDVVGSTSMDRAGVVEQGALGAGIGFALGLLLAFVAGRPRRRTRAPRPAKPQRSQDPAKVGLPRMVPTTPEEGRAARARGA